MNCNDNPRGGTFCLSKAGFGIGSTTSQVKTAAPNGAGTDYCINGILYHKADTASIAVTAASEQPALTACIYLACLNSSGTLSTVKGVEKAVDSSGNLTSGSKTLPWPAIPSDVCAIGAAKVVTDSTHTFIAGTTAFNATGITTTYYDLFAMPTTPLT